MSHKSTRDAAKSKYSEAAIMARRRAQNTWCAKNRDRVTKYQKEWRSRNYEKVLAYNREWRAKNREKVAEYQRRYWEKKGRENISQDGDQTA